MSFRYDVCRFWICFCCDVMVVQLSLFVGFGYVSVVMLWLFSCP